MTLIPPAIYDHTPDMPVIEKVLTHAEVTKRCVLAGMKESPTGWNGCTFIIKGTCYIYRVADDLVRRHEQAHCNGWRHEEDFEKYKALVEAQQRRLK